VCLAATAAIVPCAVAHADELPETDVIVISAPRPVRSSTASDGEIDAAQIEQRPLLRPADVLESVPGMIVTQHAPACVITGSSI
jgi:hypothetical protein